MKTRIGGALLFLGGLSLLGGCTAVIDQASFFPQLAEAPNASLARLRATRWRRRCWNCRGSARSMPSG
jgi:hypothetical protein